MIPVAFEYEKPRELDEALALLIEHGEDAKILAGGHSLLPLMKLRLAVPALLIDLGGIASLHYIRDDGEDVCIGAMTTYVALEDSALIRSQAPMLSQAAGMVGDMQVRNRGTLGGALAHADPAGDMPAVVTALHGNVVLAGPDGRRTLSVEDFIQDIFTSALNPDEILTEIRVPKANRAVQNYQKFRRRQIDWAIVGTAANLDVTDGTIRAASVVLTNVGPRPMRAGAVEKALHGQPANEQVVSDASELADTDLNPSGDVGGSPEYKKHLTRVMTRRALMNALALR